MNLKYALIESLITADTSDYTALVQDTDSYGIDAITQKMLDKGSTVTRADVLAVLTNFFEVVEQITREGGAIHTDLMQSRPSITGVFNGADDKFDPKRHQIHTNLNPGKSLKKATEQIITQKVDAPQIGPHITEVKDAVSGSINTALTSEGAVELVGNGLKIAGLDLATGVWFHNLAIGASSYKVATVVINTDKQLIVTAPTLPAGEYHIELRTFQGSRNITKTLHTTTFPTRLRVS